MDSKTETQPKTRTNWRERLAHVCGVLSDAKGEVVVCREHIYPASPGVSLVVGDRTPYAFKNHREAAQRIEAWLSGPM